MQFVENLKTEVARLESELASNPLFMQFQAAKKLLAIYTAREIAHGADSTASKPVIETTTRPVRKHDSARSPILEAAKKVIIGRTRPTSTVEILEALVAQGIEVGGGIPRNSLSSMLSRSEEFKAHGRSGWTLVVPGEDGDEDKELVDDANPGRETSSTYNERWLDQPAEPPAQGREAVPGGGT